MKQLKRSFALLMLLTVIIGSRTSAQDYSLEAMLKPIRPLPMPGPRSAEVIQDNEYISTGYEQGKFFSNPLLIDGKPLDYNEFSIQSKGELTVIKGAAITGETTQVPFLVHLRREGSKVFIPTREGFHLRQIKVSLPEILKYAKPGDHLIIEAANKEDGPVKRILKLVEGGC